jgi:hypothetical protein
VDEESFKVQLSREQCSLECSEVVAVGIAELSNFHTRGYETKEGCGGFIAKLGRNPDFITWFTPGQF